MMKKILFIALCLTTPFLMKSSFKLPPILPNLPPYNPDWEIPINEEVQSILNQPFTYYANGNQSTVFLSEDQTHVLKLFRYTRSRFQLLHNLKNFFKKKPKMDLWTKICKTLNAAYLGSTEAKQYTQSVYAHLNITKGLLPKTTFKVKNHIYHLDLNCYRFVVQKKVTPFKEALLSAKNDPEQIYVYMNSFGKLLSKRSSLNIRNSDPNLGPNFGFFEGKAVEIDFGNYHRISPNRDRRVQEYDNLMNRFEEWVNKNMPEYLSELKQLRIKIRSSYDAEIE